MFKFIIVFSLLGLGVSAQIIQQGQCNPDITLQANFDIDTFLGSWYEVSKTPNPHQNGECSRINLTSDGGVISIINEAVNANFYEAITGTATHEAGTARLSLNLDGFSEPVNFWVLMTDHTTYALVYNCINIDANERAVYVWQLGRTQSFSELFLALMNTSLNNLLDISLDDLRAVDFSEDACYELPVIDENQPIVLPGQCDPNIPVVQNLDVERFTGLWHEISSYYSESALGTCARAEYTLGGSVVNVLNSQVVNQGLETISGIATVIDAAGGGKLLVTLEVAPGVLADQELWVLATDYNDYALLYSCINQPNDQKRVFSWISSRTRVQTAAAQAAVAEVVDSIMDLNAMYYETTNQSDDGCFYYPEHVVDQPVVFRGQCDMGIPAMANFDAQRYMGLWHEIESYPSAFQTGTCNNALYTLDTELLIVDVFNTQVIDQQLDTIRGSATIAEDADGTGKLVVTFPIAGTNLTTSTDYWVLDTDYDNYALVYSCYNIDEDTRAVWSWKLSRTKELSVADIAAINTVASTVPVLDDRYYQNRDQSVNGCFYFPVPEAGVPVVFPGQCDDTIATVPNFNLDDFQGIWHEIETYPKIEQSGQCINHDFTQGTGNTLNLQSSQITDQFLSVTTGNVAFNSSDGSARLTITIVSDGQVIEIPYWILSTDYNDHAFAYSCVNLNSDFRGIWSWKLSRSQQLSAAAQTAIDGVIANIDVLGNEYYEPVDQSDTGCFFLPELEPGEPAIFYGQCQWDIPVVQNFNAERYAGRWRLIESYPSDFQTGTCNDATYTLQQESVLVVNTQVVNERLDTIEGSAVLASVNEEGKLLVTFPGAEPVEYWILDTDYDSYALVYSCVNISSESRRVWSWKMSRTTELPNTSITTINQIIDSIDVLNNRYFEIIDNTNAGCFYYPIPNGNPVVYRGQCDESISVVTGFDVNRYMGLWYDIESYPQEFQDGTCATATYTLNENGVMVYNTQVVNETLDFLHGNAVPDNDEGLAKLLVTFPIAGTNLTITSPYWVLDTDYDNYAVVYACVNIGEDSRRVSSWKLSRQRTLTAASESAINAVINNVQVLSQEYYVNRDHTDDGCFYFPTPEAGMPVVFPGQCDDNIQAESNFDLGRFSGLWYETAAYPKVQQEGQCVDYDFTTTTADSFSLYTTQVIDLLLDETNATVVRTSTDNTARFAISITTADEIITIPYWIISTDYDNDALAYSCVNINATFRGVWSWKLSRNRQLSEASEAAITQAMSNIDVLDNQYFESTSQTDESCFYLPDLSPEDPVVFRGQCNQSIPVVSNFDPIRYAGRWRLIESYPSDFQTGTCNDATYTLQQESVLVVNTQVVNERLDTIEGSAVLASINNEGKLLVTFPGAEPVEYWIIDTDYDSYAFVYSCVNISSESRRVWSWKMSRTTELPNTSITTINQIIDSIDVLNNRYFEIIDNTNAGCFYYPIPNGNPVVYRGQCDESISVVTGFDVNRYMGLWYDIESYPQEFQDGTCATATYTLGENGVMVYNTQVVNETLDFLHGSAVPDNDEGLAKLLVTFPIAGTNLTITSPYWVLDTDYDNYAVVYACVNIDEDARRVSSWKLSRQWTLTAASESAIDAVINNVQVLSQEYYVNRDHTDDGCFYFPTPEAGMPVVFPGQCDDNIQAESNFDLGRFSGLWYETAAYPKVQQEGQCVDYDFTTTTTNSYSLYTTQVIDLLLDETNATVVRTSTDNSARFAISITTADETITIPYWIISTDYDNHALAYSCVNINATFRGVWSWKLSRNLQLSEASEAAITQAMSNIDVLDNQYFESTSQTDESCFYLPDLSPEDPVVFRGQCNQSIPVVSNFDPIRYQGRWRLIESYQSDFQTGTCNDATYTLQEDLSVLVLNTQVIDERLDTIEGSAVLGTVDGTGKLLVTFPGANEPSEYWILDTDYDSYSLVYTCDNLNSEQRRVWSWKMSRGPTLSAEANTIIDGIVDSINVLDQQYYHAIDQSDVACFYFPEPNGNTVFFRGQCDESVSVVTNFDVERYLGLWYDVESYPQDFQNGTCSTATYSLSTEGVEVYNTQVIDETLDFIYGSAVPDNDEGYAKLIVTFPIAGTNLVVNTSYWVLATDYDNYALVYSCVNEEEDLRRVTSWKLSRQKTLSSASETAINAAINNVQVLSQQYYEYRDHTDQGCFYYPEVVPGLPVTFPGQCDDTIQAVPNFDFNRFSGLWHETAAYPKDQQEGQCVNYDFDATTPNILGLYTTQVIDQLLDETNATVLQVAGDSSARFVISIANANGSVFDIPYWILDTDYDNYAVAYSCMEIDANYRGVWSWKLSRTKQMSVVSENAISQAISGIQVLDNRYYEETSQSDESCFYLPVLAPTDPVIFNGQCDPNIQVVQNFDLTRYQGRWRLIESYFSEFQNGTCNDATYTIQGDGSVLVYNTQVIDEALDLITGSAVLATADGTGKLLVTFPGAPEPVEYWILDTDYESYALVYSCVNLNSEQRQVWSWKLSRTTTLTDNAQTAINQVINSINVLEEQYYSPINHTPTGCFYFPVPDGNPVTFRGECDDSIGVVENFDLERYMGVWYDIESYPQAFQDGTCATATYTLTADGVSVFNTQVVEQLLDNANATAVPAANDGLGKFIVTFPVAGTDLFVETPYWVLSTDYDSYALVYSCSQIDEEYRSVTSWKLSRTQQLTQAAQTAINAAIDNVQVLSNEYYNERGHSEEDCFYYPDNFGGPVRLSGQCQPQNVVENFNLNLFAGTWHETARFPSNEQTGECAANEFGINQDLQNSFILTQTIVYDEKLTTVSGPAVVTSDGRGIITATLYNDEGDSVEMSLFILDTDYTDYALVFSCVNIDEEEKQIYSWKLSRSREGLSQAANERIDELVTNNVDLHETYYEYTDQSNDGCFYYPVFEELPSAVVLPGPCDDRIQAKPNFDANAYLGRWFEISKYPQRDQVGECSRAHYSPGQGDAPVDVMNTIVNNQTLETREGTAVLLSTDGSGLLWVTFVLDDGVVVETNYYVLETDYTSFALVYSCRDLDNGDSEVYSWKLSREPTLSNEANNVINDVINNTRGLLEDYYVPTSQSDEDCFYIPEPNDNTAVYFRGQCGNVSAVEGFDVSRYLGWWHEIERYPTGINAGDCISSQFNSAGNTIEVVDTNVIDLTGQVTTGTVVSNNGVLTRTLSNGQTEEWVILDTDYDSYSLLYSCTNTDDGEYRRVWSAKHSKTRSLSEAAHNAMNPIIEANQVLYQQFYSPVAQTDAACFHYPEPTGEKVVLPGQCDDNIPTVQGFNPPEYTGRWYLIERYPYPEVSNDGTCAGARYRYDSETEEISVINWEVVDETLNSVEGTATVDGGKLIVSLPIEGTNDTRTTVLHILSTDYYTYSLVYTCNNINQFQREVAAFKLSRTRTLPANAVTAINTYMATREELYQPYFISIEHHEECPEPSSAILVHSSIVVMIACVVLQMFM